MPRRWRQVRGKLTLLADDGDNKAVRRGEHEVSRKAVAWGRPVCSPLNLYARERTFLCIMLARPRVQRAPGLPRALCLKRAEMAQKTSGASAPRAAKLRPLCFDIDLGNAQIGYGAG